MTGIPEFRWDLDPAGDHGEVMCDVVDVTGEVIITARFVDSTSSAEEFREIERRLGRYIPRDRIETPQPSTNEPGVEIRDERGKS